MVDTKSIGAYIRQVRSINFENLTEKQKIKMIAALLDIYAEMLEQQEITWNYADLLYIDNQQMRKELNKPLFEDELEMQ